MGPCKPLPCRARDVPVRLQEHRPKEAAGDRPSAQETCSAAAAAAVEHHLRLFGGLLCALFSVRSSWSPPSWSAAILPTSRCLSFMTGSSRPSQSAEVPPDTHASPHLFRRRLACGVDGDPPLERSIRLADIASLNERSRGDVGEHLVPGQLGRILVALEIDHELLAVLAQRHLRQGGFHIAAFGPLAVALHAAEPLLGRIPPRIADDVDLAARREVMRLLHEGEAAGT